MIKADTYKVTSAKDTLYGVAGGGLEFIGMRVEYSETFKQIVVVMDFTDHDLQALPDSSFEDPELDRIYTFTFPLFHTFHIPTSPHI